jgi:hypothetical protein
METKIDHWPSGFATREKEFFGAPAHLLSTPDFA